MVLTRAVVAAALAACAVSPLAAAELKPDTVKAFERYVRVTEARIDAEVQDERRFLFVDTLADADRQARIGELRAGRMVIERVETQDAGKPIDVPDGMAHHWLGLVFVPRGTTAAAVRLLQDYDRHAQVYSPAVARSRTIERTGDAFRVYLRFFMKRVISVTVDTDHDARFTHVSPTRAYSRIASTRVQEVQAPDTRSEHLEPVGRDGGYLWRINSYWRFLERDGGVYVQCESISLSRDIPFGLGWAVGPFVTSIPRDSLTFTLETTRKALGR